MKQVAQDRVSSTLGPATNFYFGPKFFGNRYYGINYFAPPEMRRRNFQIYRDTGRLDESHDLETAALVALGTDRLAAVNEVLPDPDSTDRRGWWGDMDAEEIWEGWPIGTRSWLLSRAKITDAPSEEGSTLERARLYTQEALQPFVDQRMATGVAVEAERVGLERIEVHAVLYRGPLAEIDLRFQMLWEEERR